jgi:hypothetical protein
MSDYSDDNTDNLCGTDEDHGPDSVRYGYAESAPDSAPDWVRRSYSDNAPDSAPVIHPPDSSSDGEAPHPPLTHHEAGSGSGTETEVGSGPYWEDSSSGGSSSGTDDSSSGAGPQEDTSSGSSSGNDTQHAGSTSSSAGSSGPCSQTTTPPPVAHGATSNDPQVFTPQDEQPRQCLVDPCPGGCGQHTMHGAWCYGCSVRELFTAQPSSTTVAHATPRDVQPITAEGLLELARNTMLSRAKQYDVMQTSERSIPRAVEILKRYGVTLTEEQGCQFMIALKEARLETATSQDSVLDTLVDLLAYTAMLFEAKARRFARETLPLWN